MQKCLSAIFALLWFLWMGIFIPLHTRGTIQLSGAAGGEDCGSVPKLSLFLFLLCVIRVVRHICRPISPQPANSSKGASTCLICNLVAKFSPAQPLDLSPAPLAFLTLLPGQVILSQPVPPIFQPHDTRAPPSLSLL